MSKIKIALAFATIFVLGAAAGAAGGVSFAWHRLLSPPNPEAIADHVGNKLQSRLNLTPLQAAHIRPMLLHAGSEGIAIRRDTLQRLAQTLDDLDSQILTELAPEQQKKYAEIKQGAKLIQSIKQADADSQRSLHQ